jgi:hypothetical protein
MRESLHISPKLKIVGILKTLIHMRRKSLGYHPRVVRAKPVKKIQSSLAIPISL